MAAEVQPRISEETRPDRQYRTLAMAAVLAGSDACALVLAVAVGFQSWLLINPAIPPASPAMLLTPLCAMVALAFAGLYPSIGLTAVQQIQRMERSITLVYLMLTGAMFITKNPVMDSRGAFVLAWVFSLVFVPWGRWLCARLFAHRSWWGVPTLVIGAGRTGRAVVHSLFTNQALGYRPVVCLDDDPAKQRETCEGVPVVGGLVDAKWVAQRYHVRYAVVAIPEMPRERLVWHLRVWSRIFPNLVIVPNLAGVASLWTEPRDLGGVLGLEIRHNLLKPVNQRIKRAVDVIVAALGLICCAPALAVCALWIRKISPGSPFYRQEREGKDGQRLRVIKLRTMVPNADAVLERHLAADPVARAEWDRFCKLKHDPRVLPRVGTFLRRTSLDEVPQLLNVLRGEMSLVGPRPFPAYHSVLFDSEFRMLRVQVTPGLTGLWQVSARSSGDLSVQAALDGYDIRNWSLWLDLYILIRTFRAVISGQGSY